MEKRLILAALKLLYERVDKNECTGDELDTLGKGIADAVNPLMTRKQLAKHLGKSQSTIDNAISQKLPNKFKIRNIVLYPLNEIKKILSF